MSYLIGYYILSHEEVQESLEKICIPLLCLAVIGAAFQAWFYGGKDYTSVDCLQSMITNAYLWITVLAVLGCGRKYFTQETSFTRYMTRSGFGIYILHYPILILVCFILHTYFELPAFVNYVIALVIEFTVSFAAYEFLRRVPVVRFLVLGIKNKRKP